jgi:hypothetical protein
MDRLRVADLASDHVLEPLVAVEASAIRAELGNPGPHLLCGSVDLHPVRPRPTRVGNELASGQGARGVLRAEAPVVAPLAEEGREQRDRHPGGPAGALEHIDRAVARESPLGTGCEVAELCAVHHVVDGSDPGCTESLGLWERGAGADVEACRRGVERLEHEAPRYVPVAGGPLGCERELLVRARVEQRAEHEGARRIDAKNLEPVGSTRPRARRGRQATPA